MSKECASQFVSRWNDISGVLAYLPLRLLSRKRCECVTFIFIMLMPLFCLLFLYNHSFIIIFFIYLFFYFYKFFPYDLSWRSRRELYYLIEWVAGFHRVSILFIDVFLLLLFFLLIHSLISFLFVFHPPFCAWELCLQSKSWTCLWSKIFSTFLMLPL